MKDSKLSHPDENTASSLLNTFSTIIKKKIRNLNKRKSKLHSYIQLVKEGRSLDPDQVEALGKHGEVVGLISFAQDLLKTFESVCADSVENVKKLKAPKLAEAKELLNSSASFQAMADAEKLHEDLFVSTNDDDEELLVDPEIANVVGSQENHSVVPLELDSNVAPSSDTFVGETTSSVHEVEAANEHSPTAAPPPSFFLVQTGAFEDVVSDFKTADDEGFEGEIGATESLAADELYSTIDSSAVLADKVEETSRGLATHNIAQSYYQPQYQPQYQQQYYQPQLQHHMYCAPSYENVSAVQIPYENYAAAQQSPEGSCIPYSEYNISIPPDCTSDQFQNGQSESYPMPAISTSYGILDSTHHSGEAVVSIIHAPHQLHPHINAAAYQSSSDYCSDNSSVDDAAQVSDQYAIDETYPAQNTHFCPSDPGFFPLNECSFFPPNDPAYWASRNFNSSVGCLDYASVSGDAHIEPTVTVQPCECAGDHGKDDSLCINRLQNDSNGTSVCNTGGGARRGESKRNRKRRGNWRSLSHWTSSDQASNVDEFTIKRTPAPEQ